MKTKRSHISGPTPWRLKQAGFTFAEVLVAVGVVAVTFVTLYLGITFGFAVTQTERENLRATQIMVERMEGIRLFSWDQLIDTSKNPRSFTNYFYPPGLASEGQGITYFGSVSVITDPAMSPPATYSTNMRKITVQVKWTTGSLQHTRSMSTYASRNGMQNYIYSH